MLFVDLNEKKTNRDGRKLAGVCVFFVCYSCGSGGYDPTDACGVTFFAICASSSSGGAIALE